MDIEFENLDNVTEDLYLEMIKKKTGSLIAAAAMLPSIYAKDEIDNIELFRTFGEYLGKGFQIHDDLLEITSDSKTMGKSLDSDIFEGKQTIMVIKAKQYFKESWESIVSNSTKSVLRSMMKNKYGRIINITSIVGLQGNSGQSNYSASKAGLIGFSQSVAKEVASRGITINCIAPGWIETEMTSDLPQDIKSEIIKNIPIGKTGTTEDIAYTALFLASKESKYITGQTITVDGGRVIN